MKLNSRSIKKYKGKIIALSYINKLGHQVTITGEISASTRYKFIFNVNKSGHEIVLDYDQELEIKKPEKDEIILPDTGK